MAFLPGFQERVLVKAADILVLPSIEALPSEGMDPALLVAVKTVFPASAETTILPTVEAVLPAASRSWVLRTDHASASENAQDDGSMDNKTDD